MAIKLVREFQQKQQLALTPQLRKSIDLLQLSRLEIINKINSEIEENPFILKEEIHEDNFQTNDDFFNNLTEPLTLQNFLISQLLELKINQKEKSIAHEIIYSLEDGGMLETDLSEIEELLQYEFPIKDIQHVLEDIIQQLDPAGVGGRSFKEIIFIQIMRKNLSDVYINICKEILFNPKFSNFEKAKTELERLNAESEEIMAKARSEAQTIRVEAKSAAEKIKADVMVQAGEDANKIREDAQKQINVEKDKAIYEIRQEVVSLTMMVAEKVIKKNLSKEDNQDLIEDSLKTLKIHDA